MKNLQLITVIVGLCLVLSLSIQTYGQQLSCDDDENLPDPPECPSEEDEDSVYFPVPYDCRKFYQCTNGMAKCFHCAPGTIWNQNFKECIHENETECVIVTTPRPTDPPTTTPEPTTTTSTTTPPTTTTSTTTPPTTTPSTTTPPTTTTPTTPPTTTTSTTPPTTTTSTTPPTTTTSTTTPPTTPSTTTSLGSTRPAHLCPIGDPMPPPHDKCQPAHPVPTYFPYPYDCTKYFQCSNGVAICHVCVRIGTVWDQNRKACAMESEVGCAIVTTVSPFAMEENSIINFFRKYLPF